MQRFALALFTLVLLVGCASPVLDSQLDRLTDAQRTDLKAADQACREATGYDAGKHTGSLFVGPALGGGLTGYGMKRADS